MLETNIKFQRIHAHSIEFPLHARPCVRCLNLASCISNWLSCCLQSLWIVPRLLYGVYADMACTVCDVPSLLSVMSINHSGSVGATTGDPFRTNV